MTNLDLNLLRVFDAVMRERNVLRAGQAIGLSPSAVSHGLSRLRALLNDELFVRTSSGMEPTMRALDMAPLVHDALISVQRAVGPQIFVPETSTRQFCIAATDYMTAVVLPPFLRELCAVAPRAGVTILPATRIDLTAQIDVGRIEVALGSFSNVPQRLRAQTLFEERDVLMVAPDHFLAGGMICVDQLSTLPLFVVSAGGMEEDLISERGLTRRFEMFDRVALEQAFRERGKAPDLKVIQPHFLAIPSLLAGTSAAAIGPAHLAAVFSRSGSVAVSELPWPVPPRTVQMVWHERHTRDPGHKWLRGMLEQAARRATEASPRADFHRQRRDTGGRNGSAVRRSGRSRQRRQERT